MKPNNILILGGSGFVGSVLCEKLVRQFSGGSARVTVVTSRLSHARHLLPLPTVDIALADVHDDAALERLLAGRDAVVNLVGILHGRKADFEHAPSKKTSILKKQKSQQSRTTTVNSTYPGKNSLRLSCLISW